MHQEILDWIESNPLVYRLTLALVLIVVSFPLGWLFKKGVLLFRTKVLARTDTNLDEKLAEVLEQRAKSIVFSILALYALWEIQLVTDGKSLAIVRFVKVIDAIIYIYAALVGISVAIGFIRVTVEHLLESAAQSQHQDTKQLMTVAPLARNLISLLVILIAAAIVMDHFSINIGSILVSLGVGSLAVALAAQDTIANIIAGVIIAFDQPFRVGDRIQLPNGTQADVVAIGLRSTRIQDFDLNYHIVPNSELVKSTVINFAYPTHKTRVLVPFTLPFGTDIGKVREIAVQVMQSHPFVVDDPKPELQAMRITELGIEVRLACFVADFTQRFDTEIQLREQIHRALCDAGIALAVPQRILRIEKDTEPLAQNPIEANGSQR
ncbi:MAG: mechanosensitive ion channel family protein [Chloroherpetonaceae bacterium]|nr:mechanosensitive ion channel family protein [Chloroherpetonaceae bacterium]MDW8019618.1 mechanosensitive ion channel family protein [Chloroherpetonaceae bacterium]